MVQLVTGWFVWVHPNNDLNISVTTLLAIHITIPIFS